MIGDGGHVRSGRIDFERVNRRALANAAAVVRGLLPEGRWRGANTLPATRCALTGGWAASRSMSPPGDGLTSPLATAAATW